MAYLEVPTDDQVVEALAALGDGVSARKLCDALVADGHPRPDSQLAIQRATERGRVAVGQDWTLSVVREVVAA